MGLGRNRSCQSMQVAKSWLQVWEIFRCVRRIIRTKQRTTIKKQTKPSKNQKMNKTIPFELLRENLDALSVDELSYIGFNPIGVRPISLARKLFPLNPNGRVRAVRDLHNYAANRATAMICRERGEITTALQYESICDRIYDSLPDFAKF
jgi:hypothetical protein